MFDEEELMRRIRREFALEWDGIHGHSHWKRVRQNGLLLAEETGARLEVVELFALLHDSRRRSNGHDPGHGARAAEFARTLAGSVLVLNGQDLGLLLLACRDHTEGLTKGDVTVLTCWDADRLDLGRVGIRPDPAHLCTEAARRASVIQAAYTRSLEFPE